jgi:tetratricopeptide (TPR) repeat protein
LRRAVELRADDLALWLLLGTAQANDDDLLQAEASFQRAAACEGKAADWLKLSTEFDRQGWYKQALHAVETAWRLDGNAAVALLQRSRCHKALGNAQAAAADCRRLIAMDREIGRAWFALTDLKTVSLSENELHQLDMASLRSDLRPEDRVLLDFALGHGLEEAGEFERALLAFQRANAAVRITTPWHASAFAKRVESIQHAFADVPVAQASPQGGEVIFLVGMPRSGSTLIEQVLAAHPLVEGASELPYLGQVLDAESRRRGRGFPTWVGEATADDWTRLGQHYLRLSARWRQQKPMATDKLPDNWLYVGAIRAMLPQARVIDCRRDPLETCWSCYKQLFGPGLSAYSYGFDSLAQYWRACETSGDLYAEAHPRHVRIQRYEDLVSDSERQIRQLLAFCGLPFDDACLAFQSAQRAIRTPSALQVRQPMRQASTRAVCYGNALLALRDALSAAETR